MGGGVLLGRALGRHYSQCLFHYFVVVSQKASSITSPVPCLHVCSCAALCIYKFVNVWRAVLLFTLETS